MVLEHFIVNIIKNKTKQQKQVFTDAEIHNAIVPSLRAHCTKEEKSRVRQLCKKTRQIAFVLKNLYKTDGSMLFFSLLCLKTASSGLRQASYVTHTQ